MLGHAQRTELAATMGCVHGAFEQDLTELLPFFRGGLLLLNIQSVGVRMLKHVQLGGVDQRRTQQECRSQQADKQHRVSLRKVAEGCQHAASLADSGA